MFIKLNTEEKKDIIELAAQKMNVDPIIIEKDWWVVVIFQSGVQLQMK